MSAARTRKLTHELVNAATEPKKRNTKRKTPAKAVEQPEESANMVVVSSNDEDEIEEVRPPIALVQHLITLDR